MIATTCISFVALICVTRCHSLGQKTECESSSNSLPDIVTNNGLMPAFESSPNVIPYYLQGLSAAGIAPTTVPNIDGLSWPYGLFYPTAGSNVMCKSTPNIFGLEELVPKVNNYPDIFPSGLFFSPPISEATAVRGSYPNLSGCGLLNYLYYGTPVKNELGSTTICKSWPSAALFFPYRNLAVNKMSWNVTPSRIPC